MEMLLMRQFVLQTSCLITHCLTYILLGDNLYYQYLKIIGKLSYGYAGHAKVCPIDN